MPILNSIKTAVKNKLRYHPVIRQWRLDRFDREVEPLISEKIKNYLSESPMKLFDTIEFETLNRCNGTCQFCPVNKEDDPRAYAKMTDELFHKIIDELSELNYSGGINLHCNNEPLLDKRIYKFAEIARKKIPKAFIQMYTNATILDVEKFKTLMLSLDKLHIDNYSSEGVFHSNVKEVMEYWKKNEDPNKIVIFSMRDPNEVLTTRANNAPNAVPITKVPKSSCLLPFQNIVVRPDGKISLCCCDALGENTLGDLNHQTLIEAWNSDIFMEYRKKLQLSRSNVKTCSGCDTFYGDLKWPSWKPN